MRFLLAAALLPSIAVAQLDRSALNGTVTDQEGARIPAALVQAVQLETGLERKTETSSQGTYALGGLPVGRYSVVFSKPGFAERARRTGGPRRRANADAGRTTAPDLSRPQAPRYSSRWYVSILPALWLARPLEQAQLRDLPLNGRNWSSLTALAPGAIDNGPSDQRTIRFAGHGLDDNDFLFDGVDASGILNQAQKEYVRLAIPLDSISEFQVQSQNFSADIGMTAGGQISVASPSGANTFHGGLFDYFRNNVLDARSPFDGASADPFLLNQFGASFGGPMVQNKTFFYANYEGLRQRLGQTQIGLVPSPSFAAQAESQSPALKPIIAAYPKGTSPTSNPQVWNYVAGANQVDNEDSGMLRIDHRFSDKTTAFLRYSADEAGYAIPTGALNVLAKTDTKLQNGVVELLHIFSPSLLNEARFGINQDIYHTANLSSVPFTVSVSNLSSLTGNSTTDGDGTTFSYHRRCHLGKGAADCEVRRGDPAHQHESGQFAKRGNVVLVVERIHDEQHRWRNLHDASAAQEAAQDAGLRIHPGRIQSDAESDGEHRPALFLLQCVSRSGQPRDSVRLRNLRRVLPSWERVQFSAHQRFRSAAGHRMGARKDGSTRRRRSLS